MNQTQRGKAFEFALANNLSRVLNVPIVRSTVEASERYFDQCEDRVEMDRAGAEAAMFLQAYDSNLLTATAIRLQPDEAGARGDVRDIVVEVGSGTVGLSAKTKHHAVKHSRLSHRIDFGQKWAGHPVSQDYWEGVLPIFNQLEDMRRRNLEFNQIVNKEQTVYLPVLTAFEDEFNRLCDNHGQMFIKNIFQYLIGRHDFYKVIHEHREVLVQSFNVGGSLSWGRRWTIPSRIDQIRRKPGSNHTLLVTFEGGWQLSFRIHNARKKVEPSLKFDIQFTGMPPYATGNHIPIGN